MIITKTNLEGCFVIEPEVFNDERGYFFESFNKEKFEKETKIDVDFVQDNEAKSNKGVLRGLHYQKGEFAQAKLVRVIKGRVQDVVVDLRPDSVTYGGHFSLILSDDNKKQLFIPRGFAHGYLVLEDNTVFSYRCDNYYSPKNEGGIIYNDTTLNINWLLKEKELVLSKKDLELPKFNKV